MRSVVAFAVSLVLFLGLAGRASAGTGYAMLRCWIQTGTDPTWATPDANEQTVPATTTQSSGFSFAYTADSEIQCTWIVAGDYDTAGSAPEVRLMGWSESDVSCTGLGCNLDLVVRFDVASRPRADGEEASEGWGGTSNHDEMHFTSTTCGGGSCYPSDVVHEATVAAANAASIWNPGELVFIRIRRKTSGLDSGQGNLTSSFHLADVRLAYPN